MKDRSRYKNPKTIAGSIPRSLAPSVRELKCVKKKEKKKEIDYVATCTNLKLPVLSAPSLCFIVLA